MRSLVSTGFSRHERKQKNIAIHNSYSVLGRRLMASGRCGNYDGITGQRFTRRQSRISYLPQRHDLLVIIDQLTQGAVMGKYFLGWLLGVPAIVLVLVYFFVH